MAGSSCCLSAAGLLPADPVVADCGEPGPVPVSLARAGVQPLATFNRLNARMREIAIDGDLAQLHERASRLLAYHLWMIHCG
ncbi:hypothetical protein ACWGCW_36565 [Streptomyces sp. NPDC054933]